jgi:hypothetical protein
MEDVKKVGNIGKIAPRQSADRIFVVRRSTRATKLADRALHRIKLHLLHWVTNQVL